jgi:hypothetical protein
MPQKNINMHNPMWCQPVTDGETVPSVNMVTVEQTGQTIQVEQNRTEDTRQMVNTRSGNAYEDERDFSFGCGSFATTSILSNTSKI